MAPAHPLRRISTGSLSSLARSQDRQHASPSGLEFLQPALMELTDEAATLASNTQQLNELHDALGTFNESFAGYLYALKMNAFCVEWKQAPDESTFARLASLFPPQQPEPVMSQPSQQSLPPSPPSDTHQTQPNPADMTYATAYSSSHDDMPPSKPAPPAKRVVSNTAPSAAAKKAALAAKKKREEQIGSYIEMLPLEYRGSQPSQRIAMEKLIGKLMVHPSGLATGDLVSPPDLPQAKVNKCLIALVAKKLVSKESIDLENPWVVFFPPSSYYSQADSPQAPKWNITMSDTSADDFDNETYATMNAYFSSLETAREFTKRIQGKPTLDAEDLDEGRKTFTSLHETSKAHADYTAESYAQVSDYEGDDHPGKSIYQDLIKTSAHSQAAVSAFANGTVPDLAFVLEEEPQAAPAGEALEEIPNPSVNVEADADGAGGHGQSDTEARDDAGEIDRNSVPPSHVWY